jgi:hypothetical protein
MRVRMLKKLSKEELLSKAKALAAEERRVTLELIEALREVERRMLFAELGYGSLFEFAVEYLGMSKGSAYRRVQASRLIRDVPEARERLLSGELSLTNAVRVEAACRSDRQLVKAEVARQVTGLSQDDCERKLFELSPQSVPRERERIVSPQERELRVVVSEGVYQKIERLRGLLAHAEPEASLARLIEVMADATIAREEKRRGLRATKSGVAVNGNSDQLASIRPAAGRNEGLKSGIRIPLSRPLQRRVWTQAQGCCEYEHEGRRCSSRYRLEIDHRIPLALGGSNDFSNLRLLCRAHNRQQAQAMGLALKS